MDILDRVKNGYLYECSNEVLGKELEEKLNYCKELLYDFNHTRPSELKKR